MPSGMANLRKWMAATGTTQRALALAVDLARPSLTLALSGRNGVSVAALKRLSTATGLTLGQLADVEPYIPEGE